MIRNYEVNAKCGHVGKGKCIYKSFPVRANNQKEAARKARNYPRVKHDHKDAIRYVKELTQVEYEALCEQFGNDPYFKCKNKREQRRIDGFDEQVEIDALLATKWQKKKHLPCYAYRYRKEQLHLNALS